MLNHLSDCRILIVDDSPSNIMLLGEILGDYKKSIATNGEDALKLAKGHDTPDLILLDVVMPGMDGFELCRRLKTDESTKDIPIIFITSKSEVEDETRGLELGAVDFIPKPISPPVVLARVKNHLELKMSRENLEAKNVELAWRNKYITDSINYAKRIQNAIFQDEDQLKKIFPESFSLFRPKDIVSGDFCWFAEVNDYKIFAVVDCTGHGVPGAFMSIIGNTLLNEIINIFRIKDPGQILNRLDKRVITELQKDVNINTYDGMDISMCIFDTRRNILSFAGACRPVYYFKHGEFFEIKGSGKSIGDSKKETSFVTHKIPIDTETDVYIFSDGFTDQNNSSNKKYGSGRLKEILCKIHKKEMAVQRQILSDEFEIHRGAEVQRDDVLMLGVHLAPVKEVNVISYSGPVTNDKIVEAGERLSEQLQDMLTGSQIKKLFFFVNELMQNIADYSEDTEEINGRKVGSGFIEVVFIDRNLEIRAANTAGGKVCGRVIERVNYYNSLDEDQLKALRKAKLKDESEATSKGGSMGFLEIIRRSRSPLQVTADMLSENKFTLKFYLKINLGETDE